MQESALGKSCFSRDFLVSVERTGDNPRATLASRNLQSALIGVFAEFSSSLCCAAGESVLNLE